jgi:SAM-dependent methyltransferase
MLGRQGANARQRERFFEYLLEEVDAERYAGIQQTYLKPALAGTMGDMLKYLDPILWFDGRFSAAIHLGLDQGKPQRILDIGAGPGHFPFVGRFLGHEVIGTELPLSSANPTNPERLYDDLCALYGVKRVRYVVRPFGDLSGLPGRFDLVTSFMAAFNMDDQKKPWGIKPWDFFLASLERHVLAPEGRLFMTLANNKLTPDAWRHLAAHATSATESSKSILFSEFAAFWGADSKARGQARERAGGEAS